MTAPDTGFMTGRFWLAGAKADAVSGRLELSGRWPLVVVAGELAPLTEFVVTSAEPGMTSGVIKVIEDQRLTVHGELFDGYRNVTLLDARPLSEAPEQRLEGSVAIIDAHVDLGTRFTAARARISNLDAWVRLPRPTVTFPDKGHTTISYVQPESVRLELPDQGMGVSFEREATLSVSLG